MFIFHFLDSFFLESLSCFEEISVPVSDLLQEQGRMLMLLPQLQRLQDLLINNGLVFGNLKLGVDLFF